MDAKTSVPVAVNEPIKTYAPGTSEREELQAKLAEFYAADPVEITGTFGDERRPGRGEDRLEVTMPSEHARWRRPAGVARRHRAGDRRGAAGRSRVGVHCRPSAAIFPRAAMLAGLPRRDQRRHHAGQAKMPSRPRSTPPVSSSTSCASTWRSPRPTEQLMNSPGSGTGWSTARSGLPVRDHPSTSPLLRATLPTAPALMGNGCREAGAGPEPASHVFMDVPDGRPPRGVINMVRPRPLTRHRPGQPAPGRHSLHRVDRRPSL